MKLTECVENEIALNFDEESARAVATALESTVLPLIRSNGEKVHLALIHLSEGNAQRFFDLLPQAESDWRDTLLAAGLAYDNWREVLRNRGIIVK